MNPYRANVAAIIIGIEGWDKYTLPLIDSIQGYEPNCSIVVVDNASEMPYPRIDLSRKCLNIHRTERLSYSAAINYGKSRFWTHSIGSDGPHKIVQDWYIVLSNDVLCTGPFVHILAQYDAAASAIGGADLVGPCLKETHGWHYLEGWCVACPRKIWEAIGGWDERFLGSDWEDVAFSTRARQLGFGLVEDLPFVHLDQRQRFHIVEDFWANDVHNRELFMREYGQKVHV